MNRKEFVILLIITFFVIMLWLIFDIFFRTKTSVELDPALQTLLEPISPDFDTEAINLIRENAQNRPIINPPTSQASPSASP